MNIYDVPCIEHCVVEEIGIFGYRITSHEGWYLHYHDGREENVWQGAILLLANSDFSKLEIRAKADLPEDAEIL